MSRLGMTCGEYLEEYNGKIEKLSIRKRNRKRRFLIILVLWALIIIFGATALYMNSFSRLNNSRALLHKAAVEKQELEDYVYYDLDVYNEYQAAHDFEALYLGNSNARLQSMGVVYSDADLLVKHRDDGKTEIVVNNTPPIVEDIEMSYINRRENELFYRDSKTHMICVYDLITNSTHALYRNPIGQMTLSRNSLYCISLKDRNSLLEVDLLTNSVRTLINEPISSFGIMGDVVYALNQNGVLSARGLDLPELVLFELNNIDSFSLAHHIVVFSGSKIFTLDLLGRNLNALIDNVDKFICSDKEYVYFQRGDMVYAYHISTGETTELGLTSNLVMSVVYLEESHEHFLKEIHIGGNH